eukprot:GHVL01027117.1.p1 GENE.GHVL01027117.1~~GHVL01027117.1.p1  ORF type:complete len:308 (+),score=40.89 GHVL01027117.1:51-974(+)
MNEIREFVTPQKRIVSEESLNIWLKSESLKNLVSYINELSDSVKGWPIQKNVKVQEPNIKSILKLFDNLEDYIVECPPTNDPSRYGNKAYQSWCDKLNENASQLLVDLLENTGLHNSILEILPYLLDSFGNRTRIDYGTGHEAAFLGFLYCLSKIGFFQKSNNRDIVLVVFVRYIKVMRRLQMCYCLEPAGSHGAWGLDDYHHLIFVWGAAQLELQDIIKVEDVLDTSVIDQYADEYLYLDGIRVIMQVKKGVSFAESSPVLYDVTAIPTWKKIQSGMTKMYIGEVLSKIPVFQHFLFGSLIPFPEK